MGRLLRLAGEAADVDVGAIVRRDPKLRGFRDRLAARPGGSATKAQAIVEDMLVAALHRMGEHVLTVKGKLLDDVVKVRGRLEELLHGVLDFGPKGRTKGRTDSQFEADLKEIERLYGELDDKLAKLGEPVHKETPPGELADDVARRTKQEIEGVKASDPTQEKRPITEDFTPESGKTDSRVDRKGLKPQTDGSYVVKFASGHSAEYRVVDGKYHVTTRDRSGAITGEFKEFDTLHTPYGNKPETTSLMNAHHGLQDDLLGTVFGKYGYDGDAVPTIWMRDGRSGSPHSTVSAIQTSARPQRTKRGTTLSEIREWAIADLKAAEAPDHAIAEYLAAFDGYFARVVVPRLPKAEQWRLGSWKP